MVPHIEFARIKRSSHGECQCTEGESGEDENGPTRTGDDHLESQTDDS